jgi:hypothetical protein
MNFKIRGTNIKTMTQVRSINLNTLGLVDTNGLIKLIMILNQGISAVVNETDAILIDSTPIMTNYTPKNAGRVTHMITSVSMMKNVHKQTMTKGHKQITTNVHKQIMTKDRWQTRQD